jgi:hypothetical protein
LPVKLGPDGLAAAPGGRILVGLDDGPSLVTLDPRTGALSGRVRFGHGFVDDANVDVTRARGVSWVSSFDEGIVYRH